MSVEIRSIASDEVPVFRRKVRLGFGNPETSDADPEWASDFTKPVDRALAAYDRGQIVATLRSFPTELTVPGGASVAAGALTAVTCLPTHRRQGLLTQMITRDLHASADRGEAVDVLIAAEYPIYGRFGYGPAVESISWEVDTAKAIFIQPGEGTIEAIDNETLRKEGPAIFEQVRVARPGMIGRSDLVWDFTADIRRPPENKPWLGYRVLCRDEKGAAVGWASYSIEDQWEGMLPKSKVTVHEMCAVTPAAEGRLWRFLCELDLTPTLVAGDRPADDLLPHLLHDARAARQTHRFDFLWVRPLDVVAALEGRSYDASGRVVLEVTDPLDIAEGRYALEASPEGAMCRRTDESADLAMPVMTLGAAYLGGSRVDRLHAAGWLDEHTPGSVAVADKLFRGGVTPWCNTWF